MKINVIITSIVLTFASALYANALSNDKQMNFDQYDGATCAAKKRAVQLQLEYAKQNDHTQKLYGLQKAMDNIQAHCSNEKLFVKYRNKVEDKTESVRKREIEIEEALMKGDHKKIEKLSKKLEKDRAELTEAMNKLNEFNRELGR